jgi:N utilization substance protein A
VQAEEEIEALEQDLTQAGDELPREDGSGLISDELAEERLAEVTETGEALEDEGAESLDPGREDTSELLAEHHPKEDDGVGEGNLDEPKDEVVESEKVSGEGA